MAYYQPNQGFGSDYDLMGRPVGGKGGYNGGMGGMSLPGAPAGGYNSAYGGIPQVPNPTATAGQAIQGNLGNASGLQDLMKLISQLGVQQAGQVNQANLTQAGNLNTLNQGIAAQNEAQNRAHASWLSQFNQGQAQRNAAAALLQARGINQQNQEMIQAEMQRNIPGYSGIIGQRSQNIQDELAGNVSGSTWNQLAQRAAERGATMGSGVDSPNANAALLAALGQTSEQQQALGANQLGSAIAGVPHAPLANVPIEMTPYANAPYENAPYANPPYAQAQQLDLSNFLVNAQQQQAAQEQANWNAGMPVPASAADANMNAFNRNFNRGQGGTSPGYAPPYQQSRQGGYQGGFPGGQVPYGQNQGAGASAWRWDANTGAYVNDRSGQISDSPNNQNIWQGFSQQGVENKPAWPEALNDDQWQELFGQYGYGGDGGDQSNIGSLTDDWFN